MATYLSEADHARVTAAVAAAETRTAGEIVTVVADRSDGYSDIALAWSAVVAFTALAVLALFPDFYLGLVDRMLGGWNHEWTPRELLRAGCRGRLAQVPRHVADPAVAAAQVLADPAADQDRARRATARSACSRSAPSAAPTAAPGS